MGFTDLGFHDLCWAVLGTPIFLQVADYFAPGPAPVYAVSPIFHVSFSSILYGYVYTHTHTIFHVSFSTILYGYVCTHTEFVSFGSLISSLEYLVSSSSKIGFCCKCAR